MKQIICPQEAAVARAVRTGHWQASLQAHAAGCAVCREVVVASRWLQALTQSSETNRALPDAGLLWWKAQLVQKQAQAERAQKPLEWVGVFAETILVVGPAGWFAWYWRELQGPLTGLTASLLPQVWKAAWEITNLSSTLFSG